MPPPDDEFLDKTKEWSEMVKSFLRHEITWSEYKRRHKEYEEYLDKEIYKINHKKDPAKSKSHS